jgi:hypothetical protein
VNRDDLLVALLHHFHHTHAAITSTAEAVPAHGSPYPVDVIFRLFRPPTYHASTVSLCQNQRGIVNRMAKGQKRVMRGGKGREKITRREREWELAPRSRPSYAGSFLETDGKIALSAAVGATVLVADILTVTPPT